MPRLPGGPATNLPRCPRPGHETRRVVKDGRYGTPPRQRYRCWAPEGTFHRFTPPLPREMTHPGVCDDCDSEVATHQGPALPRRYHLPLRQVSAAFVAVGSGAAKSPSGDARVGAAANPNLDGETLTRLLGDDNPSVRYAARHNLAVRLAVPTPQRPLATADLAEAFLAGPGRNSDVDLRVAAICAVTDPGRRAGHLLAYGPDWETDLDTFRTRYGEQHLPAPDPPTRKVHTRRRAPRSAAQPAPSVL